MTDLEKTELRQIIREELTMFFARFPASNVAIAADGFVGAAPYGSNVKLAAWAGPDNGCQHVWQNMGSHMRCSKCFFVAHPGVTQGQ